MKSFHFRQSACERPIIKWSISVDFYVRHTFTEKITNWKFSGISKPTPSLSRKSFCHERPISYNQQRKPAFNRVTALVFNGGRGLLDTCTLYNFQCEVINSELRIKRFSNFFIYLFFLKKSDHYDFSRNGAMVISIISAVAAKFPLNRSTICYFRARPWKELEIGLQVLFLYFIFSLFFVLLLSVDFTVR